MSHKDAQTLFEKSQVLDTPYRLGDDPRPIQIVFAALFDEAAQAVYRGGSDLDEVLVERILIIRAQDKVYEVPANFVADAELLRKSVLDHVPGDSGSDGQKNLEVFAVKIFARHDQLSQA